MREKTYIVNMLKDVSKKAAMEAQLASHAELDWQFWEAVEGRRLTPAQQAEMILPEFRERYGRSATLPAAGCSLSHIGIYRDMVANDISHALILEDDARLQPDLHLDKIKGLIETDRPVAVLLTSDFWYTNIPVSNIDGKHSIFLVYEGYMTSGYMINKAGAQLLLEHIYPVQYTADAWKIFITFGLNLYGVVPHIISYPEDFGEIGRSQISEDEPIILKIRHFCGKQKAKLYSYIFRLRGCRHSVHKW